MAAHPVARLVGGVPVRRFLAAAGILLPLLPLLGLLAGGRRFFLLGLALTLGGAVEAQRLVGEPLLRGEHRLLFDVDVVPLGTGLAELHVVADLALETDVGDEAVPCLRIDAR